MRLLDFMLGRTSIRNKITGSIMTVVFLIAAFIIIYFPSRLEDEALRGLEAKAKSLAVMLAYNVGPGLEFEDLASVNEAIWGARQNRDLSYVVLYDSRGNVFDSYRQEKARKIPEGTKSVVLFRDSDAVSVAAPVFSRGQKIGWLVMGLSLSDLKQELAHSRRLTLLVSIMIFVFGIIIASSLSKVLSEPILELTGAVRRLSSEDGEVKVEVRTNDEIGVLAKAFNQMTVDLRNSKEQLIQQGKLASLGQLAAGVAHELNNPLAGILGYSQFAMEKITGKTAKDLTEDDISSYTRYLKNVERQSQRCKTIVQDLLKFARSSDKVPFEVLDINSALTDTLALLHHQLELSRIHMSANLEESLAGVNGNANQLQQVFTNIIINSIHAMPDGGKLSISTSSKMKNGDLPERVEVVFSDTGCGISADDMTRVFDPFFTTKKVGEGTGLGLPVSYGIIKDHRGDILVESTKGEGTSFTIWIPVHSGENCAAEKDEKVLSSV